MKTIENWQCPNCWGYQEYNSIGQGAQSYEN